MPSFLSSKFASLEAYVPGEQPRDKAYIKLNTNESPYPPAPGVLDVISREAVADLRLYSDPTCLAARKAIADRYGVGVENVLVSNGSDESLNFLFMGFTEPGAVFADITYGFYKVFGDLHGIPYTVIPLNEDFTIPVEKFCGAKGTMFIANPNAPTGIALTTEQIETLLQSDPNRLVVVDEAYVDFGGETVVPLIRQSNNLAVVQTFSTSRSLAGARLGFTIAPAEIITAMETLRYSTNPYNVNRLTLLAGQAAMEDEAYFRKNRQASMDARAWTKAQLEERGFTVTDSLTNFLFAKSDRIDGGELYAMLKDRGVLVRHFTSARICQYNRITVGTMAEMETLVQKIDECLAVQGGKANSGLTENPAEKGV